MENRLKKFSLYAAIFAINLFIFSISDKYLKTIDTVGTRLIPISIINEFNMDLDEFFGPPSDFLENKSKKTPDSTYRLEITNDGKRYIHLWILTVQKDKFYTSYPIVVPILNIPFYAVAKLFVKPIEINETELIDSNSRINKLDGFISAFWTSLGALLLFIIAYKEYGLQRALFLNLIYNFTTPAFSLLSHNTWQHTVIVPVVFLVFLLISSKNIKNHYIIGALFGILPFIRPTGIFFYPLLFLAEKRNWKEWIIGASIPISIFLFIHLYIYSHPLGGYYPHSIMISEILSKYSYLETLYGLLFSPSRGLFIFMPYLLIIMPGIILLIFKESNLRKKLLLTSIPFFLHLGYYSTYGMWYGGWSYGPRFLSDNLPIFMYWFMIFLEYNFNHISTKIILPITLFLAFLIHIQPAFNKEFVRWEQCYNSPKSYHEKVMDWSNPIFLARFQKIGLLWNKELEISTKDLCVVKDKLENDFSVHFQMKDYDNFKLKLDKKYILLYENEYYFPTGTYTLQVNEINKDLSLYLKGRNYSMELVTMNDKFEFSIPKSGNYNFSLIIEKPQDYRFKTIYIKKIK